MTGKSRNDKILSKEMEENVVFVRLSSNYSEDPFPLENRPPIYLMQAQEIIKAKYEISSLIIDGQIQNFTINELAKKCILHNPRVVVLSCNSPQINEFKIFLKMIKQNKPDTFCIAVGHLATCCTKRICNPASDVDFVIRGEFQMVLPELINQLMCRGLNIQIKDYIYSKNSKDLSILNIIDNVDELPTIRFNKEILRSYRNLIPIPLVRRLIWGRVFSSYGCPHKCIFCTQTIRDTYGQNYRSRKPLDIVCELKYQKLLGANIFEFCDDNFTSSQKHLFSLCEAIIENKVDVPWGVHARIDELTYDSLNIMKRAGCIFIRCGIESGSETVIAKIKNVASPSLWKQRAKRVIAWCKELKISTIVNIVLGSPNEKEPDLIETEKMIFDLEPDIIQLHSFCAYPGSIAYDNLSEEPSDKELSEMHHHNQFRFCDNPQASRVKQKEIIRKFYLRPRFIMKHLLKFGPYYLLNYKNTGIIIKSLTKLLLAY